MNIRINIYHFLLGITILFGTLLFQSCEEYPNAYEVTDGIPTVSYIRLSDPEKCDSLIVSASLNNTIAMIGENLTSITEMWFNDQQAYLNTSFMTDDVLIVTIPNEIPSDVTNTIYMIAGSDTITEDFVVVVPAPAPQSMVCEFVADGETATINGSYFVGVPNETLTVTFPGNIEGEVLSVSDAYDQIEVVVPEGARVGQLTVSSIYGSGMSGFYFRDDRNYILDWDVLNADGGWRAGIVGNSNPAGVNGNYVQFNGAMAAEAGATWNEDAHSFNLWNASNGRSDEPFYDGDLTSAALKFECNVLEPWSSAALQMIFTPYSMNSTNGYIADGVTQRGLWMPWVSEGTYQTDGWITVTIPMSDFHYYHDGADAGDMVTTDMLGGLTFFVWNGGVDGTECNVNMCIDNIRIVPM